jgi:hypothetical protein
LLARYYLFSSGAYGDLHGRQLNILLGLTGIALSEYGYLLTISKSTNTPYYSMLIIGLFTGVTGYIALVPVSCNAYLADTTTNWDMLTIKSTILSTMQVNIDES